MKPMWYQEPLTTQTLRMAHDVLGHNGTHRTYTILKGLFYWKGLKPSVEKHIKMCYQCQRRNITSSKICKPSL